MSSFNNNKPTIPVNVPPSSGLVHASTGVVKDDYTQLLKDREAKSFLA